MASKKKKNDRKSGDVPARSDSDASMDDQEVNRIQRLLKIMEQHDLVSLEIGPDGRSLKLSKRFEGTTSAVPQGLWSSANPSASPARTNRGEEAATSDASSASGATAAPKDANLFSFLSPMVGTFYQSPSPEAPAYVKEGDVVQPDTVLCLIEAMKVFNEIHSDVSGQIVEALVENGEAVEYGQPLFTLRKPS